MIISVENVGSNKPEETKQGLVDLETASSLIADGRCLSIAGDESLLRQLPLGNWIGGSIPYFIGEEGGVTTREKLFVNDFSRLQGHCVIKSYDRDQLHMVACDAPDNGFSLIILPGGSEILSEYARNAPTYDDMFIKPIVGWVSGTHLDDIATAKPKVISGETGELWTDKAVVMHMQLPDSNHVHLDIVNLFSQGDSHEITFPRSGFSAGECLVDGKPENFSRYLMDNGIDTRLPLVADYSGAMINVSIKANHHEKEVVEFYAPVFEDAVYRVALPVGDYIGAFEAATPTCTNSWVFSCNCILNYLFLELEGKQTADITGPITFGEIAYQLLNQTMVYLSVESP